MPTDRSTHLRFPLWFRLVFVGVHLWYVTVPAAAALLLAGWLGAGWLGGFRWVVFGAAWRCRFR